MHNLQVKLSVLFVGNKHEDVDAGFNKTAEKPRMIHAKAV